MLGGDEHNDLRRGRVGSSRQNVITLVVQAASSSSSNRTSARSLASDNVSATDPALVPATVPALVPATVPATVTATVAATGGGGALFKSPSPTNTDSAPNTVFRSLRLSSGDDLIL